MSLEDLLLYEGGMSDGSELDECFEDMLSTEDEQEVE